MFPQSSQRTNTFVFTAMPYFVLKLLPHGSSTDWSEGNYFFAVLWTTLQPFIWLIYSLTNIWLRDSKRCWKSAAVNQYSTTGGSSGQENGAYMQKINLLIRSTALQLLKCLSSHSHTKLCSLNLIVWALYLSVQSGVLFSQWIPLKPGGQVQV